jgi:FkbM family methyltransferase
MINYSNLIKTKTNILPKTILEIGSMHGHDANILKNEFNLKDFDVWVVEPNPFQQDKIAKDYPNFNLVKNPIFDKNQEHEFYQVLGDDAGTSSLFDRVDSWYECQGNGLKKIKVNTITGIELLESINKKIELCKLDVEGLSYNVLNSFGDKINDIISFHIECEHKEVWKDQKLYLEVKEFMENKNYEQIYFKYVVEDILQSDSIWVLKQNIIK